MKKSSNSLIEVVLSDLSDVALTHAEGGGYVLGTQTDKRLADQASVGEISTSLGELSNALTSHVQGPGHVTQAERDAWNAKSSGDATITDADHWECIAGIDEFVRSRISGATGARIVPLPEPTVLEGVGVLTHHLCYCAADGSIDTSSPLADLGHELNGDGTWMNPDVLRIFGDTLPDIPTATIDGVDRIVATRHPAYQIGNNTDKLLQPAGDYALKSEIPESITQVNADWNATSGVAQILNKPTIPTTAADIGALAAAPLAGKTYDCSTNAGYYRAIEDIVRALGGTITNSQLPPAN